MITPDPHRDRPGQDAIHPVQVAGAHRRTTAMPTAGCSTSVSGRWSGVRTRPDRAGSAEKAARWPGQAR